MHEVTAIGATLLHSLWQATMLAGLLRLVSRNGRLSSATRYRIAYGALLLQGLLSILTFLHYHTPAPRLEATVKQAVIEFVSVNPAMSERSSFTDPAFWMSALVACWLLSVLVGASRLTVSFCRVRRMQREFGRAIPSRLTAVVNDLADRIGYRGRLTIRVGKAISAPVLIGHLKPILLLPFAIINQLGTEEAETVILHELAHLRRYDHWFNLLQCLIEVIFYYHPAVHWMGARIREEREYCCDDLVLVYGPGRLPYARALLHYGQTAAASPSTVLSLTDGGGLLARVTRFLYNRQITYTMERKFFLLPLLAAIVLVTTAAYTPFLAPTEPSLPSLEKLAPAFPALNDTLPPGKHEVTRISNGKVTKVRVEDREIKELEIDGRVVPKEEYSENETLAEELITGKVIRASDHRFPTFDGDSFLKSYNYNFDSLGTIYENALRKVNIDSMIGVAKGMGQAGLDLDSLYITWGDRNITSLKLHGEALRSLSSLDSLTLRRILPMHKSFDLLQLDQSNLLLRLADREQNWMQGLRTFEDEPLNLKQIELQESRLRKQLERLEAQKRKLLDNLPDGRRTDEW